MKINYSKIFSEENCRKIIEANKDSIDLFQGMINFGAGNDQLREKRGPLTKKEIPVERLKKVKYYDSVLKTMATLPFEFLDKFSDTYVTMVAGLEFMRDMHAMNYKADLTPREIVVAYIIHLMEEEIHQLDLEQHLPVNYDYDIKKEASPGCKALYLMLKLINLPNLPTEQHLPYLVKKIRKSGKKY